MEAFRSSRPRSRLNAAFLAATLVLGNAVTGPRSDAQTPSATPSPPHLRHDLQDMRFVGTLVEGTAGDPAEDVLTFDDGTFSTRRCGQYGFAPAPYWVRVDDQGLHFRATLDSPGHGTMHFEGLFDGREMHATAVWRRERWYWTLEQTFRFTGRPEAR